jgi:1-acyl-sn-glycerol-3-phosphate acyltransferase
MSQSPSDPDSLSGRILGKLDRFVGERIDPDIMDWIETLIQEQDEFGFDPFGFQPDFLKYVLPFGQFLLRKYFRAECFGIDQIPDERVLVVANHSGQIPIDGFVIVSAGLLERKPPRMFRAMVEKWVPTLPFASYFLARTGQVVGTPENCTRLLEREEAILVFPEGVRGISKTFDQRYRLQQFGLGFMRLALRNHTPIVPLGVIGAEEQAPSFANAKRVAKLLSMPSFPLTPTFPWLGPLGLLPYPVKYRLHFGEPITFDGDPDDSDAAIGEKVDEVKTAIQALLDHGLSEREAVFF